MWWLWIVGPIAVGLLYILTGRLPDRRRSLELDRWKAMWQPAPAKGKSGKKSAKGKKPAPLPGPPEVSALPGELGRVLDEAGGGTAVAYFELVPRLGYFAVMEADATNASDYQAVVAKLGKSAPAFVVRPLPIVEGSRIANTGVQFKKDPEFMELFLVEGADAAAIGKWLRRPIRSALMSNPNLWLFVRGRAMGLALYGSATAEEIDELIACADTIFAEVGAEGGPSLLGADEQNRATEDEDDDEDDAEDEDEDAEDEDEGDAEDEDEDDDDEAEEEAPKPKVTAKPAQAKAPVAEKPAAKSSPVKTAAATTAADAAAVKQSKPAGASPSNSKGSPARKA